MDHSRRAIRSTDAIGMSLLAIVLTSLVVVGAQPQDRQAGSAPATAGNGRQLYDSAGCAQCHGDAGQGGNAGPRLAPNSIPLRTFIDSVRAPAGAMPPYTAQKLPDAQLAEIHAFLVAAPFRTASAAPAGAPAGNAANGQKLFNDIGCWSCHGYSGQGARTGPRLAPDPIPFEAFVRYVRAPAEDMPPYTTKVISDAQLADIHAFLRAVPRPRGLKDIPALNR